MIQRVQSIYLLLAVVAGSIGLLAQVGYYEPETMGGGYRLYNLYILDAEHHAAFTSAPLFCLLALATMLSLVNIFLYKNRRRQIRCCTATMTLLLLWNLTAIAFTYLFGYEGHTFHFLWGAFMPAVAFLFCFLARRAIQADERLVRAADRIR